MPCPSLGVRSPCHTTFTYSKRTTSQFILNTTWNMQYRVTHIEVNDSKWPWGVEGSTFFKIMVPRVFMSGGGIWVWWTSSQKSNIGWPQQPLTEMVLISVKNWIFDDPFHKKGPGMIQPSGSVMFLMKWGCRGHWGCIGSKVWKIPTEDFRVIQVLEFSFILMFWKNIVLVDSWNILLKS